MNGGIQPTKKLLNLGGDRVPPTNLPPVFKPGEWDVLRQGNKVETQPHVLADLWHMPTVAQETMDAVYSSHNLEMLYVHQAQLALAEFFRVLKPGGFAIVSVSDVQAVAAYVAEGRLEGKLYDSAMGPVSPIDLLYGFRKDIEEGKREGHKCGFSAVTLARSLQKAGFTSVTVRREWINLWAVGFKLPQGHPQRRETPAVENIDIVGQKGTELPWAYRRLLEIQQDPDIKSDNIDEAPQIWKPLGLA